MSLTAALGAGPDVGRGVPRGAAVAGHQQQAARRDDAAAGAVERDRGEGGRRPSRAARPGPGLAGVARDGDVAVVR